MIGVIVFWFFALSAVFGLLWRFAHDVYVFVLAPQLGRLVNLKEVGGEWAVVTGAGAGIGSGYALALAAKGINVCLIGRTESNLKAVAKKCEEKYNVKTKVIVHDFAKIQDNDAEIMKSAVGDIFDKVGLLINNVGIMGGDDNFITSFIDNTPNPIDFGREMVTVNIQSVVLMCGIFLPAFIKRNRGVIVNVASSAGYRPMTGHAVYSASKVFVDFFTESLRQESTGSDVIIQTVNPFSVRTGLLPKWAFNNLPSLIAPTGLSFARDAVNSIGLQERTSGCFSHQVQSHLLTFIDNSFPKSVGSSLRYYSMIKFKTLNEDLDSKKQQ